MLKDEQGHTMRVALFNDDIEAYEDVIQHNMEYEISNASVKLVDERFQTRPNEFQMSFNDRTLIQPLQNATKVVGPEYYNIATIPRATNTDDRYDLLGVAIFVEPKRTVTIAQNGKEVDVREIVFTNYSTAQTITVSAWNDLALNDCNTLSDMISSFPVVGFTALKPAQHKGFSLSTIISTFMILDLKEEKVDSLKAWSSTNFNMLLERKTRVVKARMPSPEGVISTLREIKSKKAANTIQEERHWLCVHIENFDNKDARLYLGCKKCGKLSDVDKDVAYTCSNCNKESISVPR